LTKINNFLNQKAKANDKRVSSNIHTLIKIIRTFIIGIIYKLSISISIIISAWGSSTVVEHSPHWPKVKDSSPANAAGTAR